MTRYNTNLVLLGIIVLLVFALATCNSCKNAEIEKLKNQPPKVEVVQSRAIQLDTVLVPQTDTFTKTVLKPYAVIKSRVDSFIAFEPKDTCRHSVTSLYLFSDTSRTKYGNVIINDSIEGANVAFRGRSLITDFQLPTITRTVTERLMQKKTVKGFLTASVQGSGYQPVQAVGAGFMLQFKNDNAIEAQVLVNRDFAQGWLRQPFQLSYKQKISFK